MLKAVIFDMDGTLLDSEIVHFYAICGSFKERVGYELTMEEYLLYCGIPDDQMWPRLLKDLSEREDSSLYGQFTDEQNVQEETQFLKKRHWELYDQYIREHGVNAFPGMEGLLSELKENGVKISIATGSYRHIVRSNMEQIGITEYVDAIATSEDCDRGKPEPDVFLAAAKFLGVEPSECLVVEDSRNGLIGAKRAGMCCVGFGGSQVPAQIELAPVSFNDYRTVSTADFRRWYEEQSESEVSQRDRSRDSNGME